MVFIGDRREADEANAGARVAELRSSVIGSIAKIPHLQSTDKDEDEGKRAGETQREVGGAMGGII